MTSTDLYAEKVLHAAQQAFAERELFKNKSLLQQNNEKRTRKHIKERKTGDAKVMSHKDIMEATRFYESAKAKKEKKKAE